MKQHCLTNGVIQDEERFGNSLECPNCKHRIEYSILKLDPGIDIYLYCDTCSNFSLRDEDREVALRFTSADEKSALNNLKVVYYDLQHNLPPCGCGGHFKIWSNVKCPHCHYEYPYDNGRQMEQGRFMENHLVWVLNAIAYRGANRASNRLVRTIKKTTNL